MEFKVTQQLSTSPLERKETQKNMMEAEPVRTILPKHNFQIFILVVRELAIFIALH